MSGGQNFVAVEGYAYTNLLIPGAAWLDVNYVTGTAPFGGWPTGDFFRHLKCDKDGSALS